MIVCACVCVCLCVYRLDLRLHYICDSLLNVAWHRVERTQWRQMRRRFLHSELFLFWNFNLHMTDSANTAASRAHARDHAHTSSSSLKSKRLAMGNENITLWKLRRLQKRSVSLSLNINRTINCTAFRFLWKFHLNCVFRQLAWWYKFNSKARTLIAGYHIDKSTSHTRKISSGIWVRPHFLMNNNLFKSNSFRSNSMAKWFKEEEERKNQINGTHQFLLSPLSINILERRGN